MRSASTTPTGCLGDPSDDGGRLADEAERYLAAVAVFRAAGCEPLWQSDPLASEQFEIEVQSVKDALNDS